MSCVLVAAALAASRAVVARSSPRHQDVAENIAELSDRPRRPHRSAGAEFGAKYEQSTRGVNSVNNVEVLRLPPLYVFLLFKVFFLFSLSNQLAFRSNRVVESLIIVFVFIPPSCCCIN